MISIIIPAYNEEATVEEIVNKIYAVPLDVKKEIIIINDGSLDKTGDILAGMKNKFDFISLEHKQNSGKGAAIKTGLTKARGDIIIIQDADLEYSPNDYKKLLAPFSKNGARVVYGSRILQENKTGHWLFYAGGKIMTIAANFLYGIKITDESTCYKVFKKDLIMSLNIQSNGFEFCSEVTAKIAKLGVKIYEVPISYFPRNKKDGKKIKIMDGVIGVWTLLRYRFF
jgi:glycosyltransferase involved in cell wall biosynthesis